MRLVVRALLCAGALVVLAGCDPTTERRYFTEGAGVDLYTADRAQQVELQNQYVDFICAQSGDYGNARRYMAMLQTEDKKTWEGLKGWANTWPTDE